MISKKIFFTSLLFTFSFFLFSFQLSSKIEKKVKKEIKDVFETSEFTLASFSVKTDSVIKLDVPFTEDNFLSIKLQNKLVGYAYVGEADSKTAEFDYLIILDENLTIKKAKVLMYREEYGGEIASTRWLKQFIGITEKSNLIYQKDIAAISGATISVKSMTYAVNDLLKSIHILHENNIL